MMKRILIGGVLGVLALAGVTFGEESAGGVDAVKAYRSFMDVGAAKITVPTVLEVPLGNAFLERSELLVVDTVTNEAQPYYLKQGTFQEAGLSATGPVPMDRATDGDMSSYADFPLPETEQGRAEIVLTGSAPIKTSALTIAVAENVALPNTIQIRANAAEGQRIVLATGPMRSRTVYFPETSATTWFISLTYGQPLRITDIKLHQQGVAAKDGRTVRFLAQPGSAYRIYFNPDRHAFVSTVEGGNLSDDRDVIKVSAGSMGENPAYVMADQDGDGLPDIRDNCVSLANADQADTNGNGRGDACDDFDRDGRMNSADNCVNKPNGGQADEDGDGVGDACDGEESRVTEKYAWLPWAGMGAAALVLVTLFGIMLHSLKKDGGIPPA